jgi:hypothetical protein
MGELVIRQNHGIKTKSRRRRKVRGEGGREGESSSALSLSVMLLFLFLVSPTQYFTPVGLGTTNGCCVFFYLLFLKVLSRVLH